MTSDADRLHGSEPRRAVEKFRALAASYRLRVEADVEGFPIIPGRYGQIEWYCDGVDCHSCVLPDQFALAVYTERPRLFSKIWAIPGVKKHQTGDSEMRAVFPPEALEQVATVVVARRKRTQASPQSLRNLRSRATSRTQEPRSFDRTGSESETPELRR